jgi:asparagine synthase (glutamine-hydrolysing)
MPFLDHRIVELMGQAHPAYRIQGLKENFLLKRVFKGILPDDTIRRRKHPYRAPIHACLLGGDSELVKDVLSDTSIEEAGLFHKSKVGRLLGKIRSAPHVGEVDDMALAGILSSQLLFRQFVDGVTDRAVVSIHPSLVVDLRTSR